MKFEDVVNVTFFRYNDENRFIDYTKNYINLIGNNKIDYVRDKKIIKDLDGLKIGLMELKQKDDIEFSWWVSGKPYYDMPKFTIKQSKEIIDILLDKINKMLKRT